MDCREFKDSLFHFQADELPHVERVAFEDHLNACPPCAERFDVEEGLLRGLRTRLKAVPAPPGLETRIRASLDQAHSAVRPGAGWLRAPWFAAMAATILLAVLLVPSPGLFRSSATERVSSVVTLVDRACDLAGRTHAEQRGCNHPKHLNAFRLDDGTYWDLSLDHAAARDLVTDRAMRGRRMHVEGLLYERIHTLQLESAQPVGEESASLRLTGR